jgi:multiple sugar transport system permease protein
MTLSTLADEAPIAASASAAEASRSRPGVRPRPWLRAGRFVALSLGGAVMVAPFVDMILGALRSPAERLARPPIYVPADPQWENFAAVFRDFPLGLWLFNSFAVTIAITALQLATSTTAAYALAKFRFRGRDLILKFVVVAQVFPFFLLIIPLFIVLRYFPLFGGNDILGQGGTGLLDTYAALILPFAVSWYGVFLMRQFMISVPDELIDAARIDGAGELRILWSVVLPLVRPALLTLGIFVFIYHWNEVVWTLTVTRTSPDLQTGPVGIHLMRGAFDSERDLSLQQAAIAVTVLPVIVLFLALQRFYARTSGMKA